MKYLLFLLMFIISTGCDLQIGEDCEDCNYNPNANQVSYTEFPYQNVPPVDLPVEFRERNYAGGSCVHASMETILRWQGLLELADWWRATYSGGEGSSGLISKSERAGLRYGYTTKGDVGFLDWASRTRRGAVIFYKPNHSISFFGWSSDGLQAVLCDNNRPKEHEYVERETFIRKWKGYGGFALTPIYNPQPPRPWL